MEPTLENVRKAYGQYVRQALKYGYKPRAPGQTYGFRSPYNGYHQTHWISKMPKEFHRDNDLYDVIAMFRIQDDDIKRLEDFMDSAGYTDAQKRVVYKYVLDGVEYIIAEGFSPKGPDEYSRLELSGVPPREPVAVGAPDPLRLPPKVIRKTVFEPGPPRPGGTRRRKSSTSAAGRRTTRKGRSGRSRSTGNRKPRR
jgi:hypothetical protein